MSGVCEATGEDVTEVSYAVGKVFLLCVYIVLVVSDPILPSCSSSEFPFIVVTPEDVALEVNLAPM
jgi:hypothetical protein